MKILHLMLSNFYIDDANYQENIIPRINKRDGNDVLIVASTDIFVQNNILGSTRTGEYINEDGIKVIRIPYAFNFSNFLAKKIRAYKGLWKIMEDFQPDVILFHGAAAYEINTVGRYVKKFPKVKFYVDSHEDAHNSARGFFSKKILYRLFYSEILKRNLKYISTIYYITKETRNFIKDVYGIRDNKLKFLPLGGEVPPTEEREKFRINLRNELDIDDNHILCIHSGKLDAFKRTSDILESFSKVKRNDLSLIIIGSIDKSFEPIMEKYLAEDKRIKFLGWKKAYELKQYLMASDLYIQFRGQSATMQQAVCNGSIVAVYPYESHLDLLKESCFYIKEKEDLITLFETITIDKLRSKRNMNQEIINLLDYNEISRFYENY